MLNLSPVKQICAKIYFDDIYNNSIFCLWCELNSEFAWDWNGHSFFSLLLYIIIESETRKERFIFAETKI